MFFQAKNWEVDAFFNEKQEQKERISILINFIDKKPLCAKQDKYSISNIKDNKDKMEPIPKVKVFIIKYKKSSKRVGIFRD